MTATPSPYPGLRPFREDEHPFFFGRYEHTTALYRLLDRGRFLAVLGGSGSGKSSLVQAGLLPLLAQERRGSAPRWTIVSLRPGTHPINRLAIGLLKVASSESETIPWVSSGLRRSSHGLAQEVGRMLPADREVLVLVDQYEELFRYADVKDEEEIGDRDPGLARPARDDESRRFVEALLTASTLAEPRIRVILTMRSDFLGDCARYPGLAEAVSANLYLTPRLHRDQQTEAIVGPLLRHAGRLDPDVVELTETKPEDWSDLIEPQLVEQLKNDAGDDPDQLPVLQHALLRCWQKASGGRHRLTLARYRWLGGWGVILSNHADWIKRRCEKGRPGTVERIFRALTERDRAGRATRRPRTTAQLIAETGDKAADVRAVIRRFSAPDCSFLVPPTPADELVDIGHEALIRQWDQIAHPGTGWLHKEFRDGLIWQSLLVDTEAHEQNAKHVLPPTVIEERQRWFKEHNSSWAERYGGQWHSVDRLVRASVLMFDQWRRAQEAERQRIEAVATSIGSKLELPSGEVARPDVEALIALASASNDERMAFVNELLRRPALAECFTRNPAVVARALVGLDSAVRQEVITHAFGPASATPENPEGRHAKALLGIELRTSEAVAPVLAVMQATTAPYALKTLGQGLSALPVKLTPEQTRQAVAPILAAMERNADPAALETLGQGLAALPVKLTPEQARRAVAPILATMHAAADPGPGASTHEQSAALEALGQALAALPVELTPEQTCQAVAPILAAMQGTTVPEALKALGQGLAALRVELTAEQARQVIAPFLTAMQGTTNPDAMGTLGQGLAVLPVKLNREQARQAIAPFLAAIQGTAARSALKALGNGLEALAPKLTIEQAGQAIEAVLAAMQGTAAPHALEAFAQGLAALAAKLTAEQAQRAIAPLLAAIAGTTDTDALQALGHGLAALAVELNAEQAGQAIDPLLGAMKGTTNPYALGAFADVLAALAAKLTAEQATQAIEPLLAAMNGTTDGLYPLRILGLALAALAPKLTPEQAGQAVAPILAIMQRTANPDTLEGLGRGLTALPVEITPEQASQAIAPILAAMQGTTNPDALRALSQVLAALAAKLPTEQGVQALIDALKIPWMAGPPSEPLQKALQVGLMGKAEPQANLWEIIAQIEQRFGKAINLTTPPRGPTASAGA